MLEEEALMIAVFRLHNEIIIFVNGQRTLKRADEWITLSGRSWKMI
jgi:hypothetical protein